MGLKTYKPYFVGKVSSENQQFLLEEQRKFAYKEMFIDFLKEKKMLNEKMTPFKWADTIGGKYRKFVEDFVGSLRNLQKEDKDKITKFLIYTVQVDIIKLLQENKKK